MTERSNLITTNSFTPDKLKVETPKEKKSKGGKSYYNSQISYAGGKARILLSGVFQVSDYAKKNFGKELSLILLPNEGEEIEKNLKLLNDLQCALNLEEGIRLHTDGLVFMRLYSNAKFWKLTKVTMGQSAGKKSTQEILLKQDLKAMFCFAWIIFSWELSRGTYLKKVLFQ